MPFKKNKTKNKLFTYEYYNELLSDYIKTKNHSNYIMKTRNKLIQSVLLNNYLKSFTLKDLSFIPIVYGFIVGLHLFNQILTAELIHPEIILFYTIIILPFLIGLTVREIVLSKNRKTLLYKYLWSKME